MKKLTDRQKQAIATKLKITQIATDLFKKKGFDSVKIQDICAAAEISTGAFYYHFKSKNDIINTGYAQVDMLVMERVNTQIFNSNIAKLSFLISEGCNFLQELGWIFVGDVYKNLLSIDGKYSFNPDRFVTLEIKAAINAAIKSNELQDDVNSDELTEILLRISRGAIFDWCLQQGGYNLKEKIIFDLNLILTNYKA